MEKRKAVVVRYDMRVKSRILELCSSGYSLSEIANLISVNYQTLHRWRKIVGGLRESMDLARDSSMKQAIDVGLFKLATGFKVNDYTTEYTEQRTDNRGNKLWLDDEKKEPWMQKVKKVTHNLAPNVKAIEILARKYRKEFVKNDSDAGETKFHLTLDTGGMSIKELQEVNASNPLESTNKPIEAEYTTVKEAIRLVGEGGAKSEGAKRE